MLARDGELGYGHDPPAGTGMGPVPADGRQTADRRSEDPAVSDTQARRYGQAPPVGHDRSAGRGSIVADDRIVGVENQRAGRIDQLGKALLDLPVGLERAVPVEVIGRHVGVDRDRGPVRQRRQLELRELDDDSVFGRELREPFDQRDADVAAEDGRMGRIGGEQRRGQRRGGGLALRAGDPDRRARAHPQEQVRLAYQGRVAVRIRQIGRDDCPQRRPEAGLGRGEVRVDARRRGDEVRVGPGGGRLDVRTQAQADRPAAQRFDRCRQVGFGPAVVDGDVGARVGEEAGQGDAAAGQTEDGDGAALRGSPTARLRR